MGLQSLLEEDMKVASIRVRNFRNHRDTFLEFGEDINLLVGGNGQGKTNLLEAISYFGLTKSFFAAGDSTALTIGQDAFSIEGHLLVSSGLEHTVEIRFDRITGEKEILVDRAPLERLHHLVGRFPVVLLSPESGRITSGPPGERRRFLDLVLSQRSRSYFEDILEYRRLLRQRNCLLLEMRGGGRIGGDELAPWTEKLSQVGARIVRRRRDFVSAFRPSLSRAYARLTSNLEGVDMRYHTKPEVNEDAADEEIADGIERELGRRRGEEIGRGSTLTGPHRDDLHMTIDGREVQAFGSHGQHKTLLLAMKIAEHEHLSEMLGEMPVFLLDDLFGELDMERSDRIVRLLMGMGQSIITTTSDTPFAPLVTWNGQNRRYAVEHGTCRQG
jgi:DNA replication and repair protein RecF